ncbi:hypothetical protein BGZ99_007805 [Dissophora globulifera]|uniref:CRAL-TRIO domain-containing protein n=1 Tax=Dissophora globulifera TaxID=979702 RepID=A0A9P6RTB0_9FUNG|nr:hypothetical protein BGZ99_007805 [Dissophora globulifera]
MKNQSAATGHLGNLTQDQWDALGEIWSFLLHLWYSEPSSPSRANPMRPHASSDHAAPTPLEATGGDNAPHDASSSPTSPSSPGGHNHSQHASGGNDMRPASPPPTSPTHTGQPSHRASITSLSTPNSPSNNPYLPGGTTATAAALKRSASNLKSWQPSKKFTFKYSPSEYHTAFWAFTQCEHPDTTVLRFLRARKWNVEKAMEMLVLALEWRITMGVDEIIKESEEALEAKYPGFLEQLKTGKVIFRGHDRQGRPLCLLNPGLHFPNAQSEQAVQKLSIYVVETARLLLRPPTEMISVIFDMSSFSTSNMDWPTAKFFIHAAEACYPELLGVCVMHKAPWIFGALWKIISPMLDPVIRAKIQFTSSNKDLVEFVAPDQLMSTKAFGGDDTVPYQYKDPVPGENRLMEEDSAGKERAIAKRKELELTFERLTEIWQGQKQLSSCAAVTQERNEVGLKLGDAWWAMEPYTRARTVYHRLGAIHPGPAA